MTVRAIQLTTTQADEVRGEASPGYWLEPIQIGADAWIIPARVLTDPGYARWRDYLAPLPQIDYTPPPAEDE